MDCAADPIASRSIYEIAGIPNELGVALVLLFVSLGLAPWLGGRKIASLEIPELPQSARRSVRWVGPVLVVVSLLGFFPWIPSVTGFATLEPVLLSPEHGATFEQFPRTIKLEWEPLEGAARYQIEVQLQDPRTGTWHPVPDRSTFFSDFTDATLEFIGAQPGRWRVAGISGDGTISRCSSWWRFVFVK